MSSAFNINTLRTYANANDRYGYYNYLSQFDKYGELAKGVVTNETTAGFVANKYFSSVYEDKVGTLPSADKMREIGLDLMQRDLAAREFNILDNGTGLNLDARTIRDYHAESFSLKTNGQVGAEGWTAFLPLNDALNSGDTTRVNEIWNNMLQDTFWSNTKLAGTGIYDSFDLPFIFGQSQTGMTSLEAASWLSKVAPAYLQAVNADAASMSLRNTNVIDGWGYDAQTGQWIRPTITHDAEGFPTQLGWETADAQTRTSLDAERQKRIDHFGSNVTGSTSDTSLYEKDGKELVITIKPGKKTVSEFDNDNDTSDFRYRKTETDGQGRVLEKTELEDTGTRRVETYDPLDERPETRRVSEFDADGDLTGTISEYDTADTWFNSHDLNDNHLRNFDESALNALTQEIERSAFHGDATPDSTPYMLSYESQFGSGYDFNTGNFDVDSGGAFTSTAPDVNLEGDFGSYDPTWLDWDTSGYGTDNWDGGWDVSSFDGWDYGDWFFPIVLDLNGDGVDITSRVDSTVYFDIDGDGYREQTAWAGATDGLLVIDLAANGSAGADGVINQAKEVSFALQTADPNDTDAQALKTLYDTNGDGKLTSADARWGEFRVWKDANQNGVVDSGEMQTLAQQGITEVALSTDNRGLFMPDGSRINGFGSFTMNGVTRTYADAGFAYDEVGFNRVTTVAGFDYVAEGGGTKSFIDANIYKVNPTTGAYDPNGVLLASFSFTMALNYLGSGGTASDGLIAGSGNDDITAYGTKAVTIYGAGGNDDIQGAAGNDVLDGGSGKDILRGLAGDDTIYFDALDFEAGIGRLIDGGEGYDTAIWTSTSAFNGNIAEDNVEAFIGNAGNDVISAVGVHLGPSNTDPRALTGAFIDGRAGDDTITGGALDDILVGGLGNDTIRAGSGGDLLHGGDGADFLDGQAGDDTLFSGDGNDVVFGSLGADVLYGGNGGDALVGDGPVTWDGNAAAVRRLYIATLNRAPDDGGHQSWAGALAGGQSLQQIATGFINSAEFQNKYGALNNTQFVTKLYENVLHRAPDPGGLSGWVNSLNSGASRESVVVGFSESQEFKIESDVRAHAGQIYRMYDSAFNRGADVGGFSNWIDTRYGGIDLKTIANGFMQSQEFTNTYGNINSLSNTQFVQQLYINVLNRTADPGGLTSWVSALNGGTSRSDVLVSFSESQEHINLMASGLDAFMRNNVTSWHDVLEGGAGNDVLTGGRGSDRFVFNFADGGADTVFAFESFDTIELKGFGYTNASQALAHMSQQGSNVVFTHGPNTVVFHDTQISTLQNLSSAGWMFS